MSNVYSKLQIVKVGLRKTPLNKSGLNDHNKMRFFELGDFMPTVDELFLENGLSGYCSFDNDIATLVITNIEKPTEQIFITSPMKNIKIPQANDMQSLGGVETYSRRYLYTAALDIIENDVLDSVIGKKATTIQINNIKSSLKLLGKTEVATLAYYKVKKFEDMLETVAEGLIEMLNKQLDKKVESEKEVKSKSLEEM